MDSNRALTSEDERSHAVRLRDATSRKESHNIIAMNDSTERGLTQFGNFLQDSLPA